MGLFGKTKNVPFEDIRVKESQALGKDFLSTLQAAVPKYKPGADFGDTGVDLTSQERKGIGYLDQYLDQDIRENSLYQAGRKEITDTLEGGKFDPSTGEFFKATRAGIDLSTQEAVDRARRGQAARGAFRSSGGLRQEGDILTESNIATQSLYANIAERERQRRATAGKQALQLSEFESNIPLSKAEMSQRYGALERQNEVQNLEREYTKWQNQRDELMKAFTTAGQASNYGQPVYGKTSTEVTKPTFLGKTAQLGLTVAGGYLGGPAGAQAGSQAGQFLQQNF